MPAAPGGPFSRQYACSALLSARLYADALEDPNLRYAGVGTMPIGRALDFLLADGQRDKEDRYEGDRAWTHWMTRFRVATALKLQLTAPGVVVTSLRRLADELELPLENDPKPDSKFDQAWVAALQLAQRLDDSIGEDEARRKQMLESLEQLRAIDPGDRWGAVGPLAGIDRAAQSVRERERVELAQLKNRLVTAVDRIGETLPPNAQRVLREAKWDLKPEEIKRTDRPVAWHTDVLVEPAGATRVTSWIEVVMNNDAFWRNLVYISDPRNWRAASIFWERSEAADGTQPEWTPGQPFPDHLPEQDVIFDGVLQEVVYATARFHADLRVTYKLGDRSFNITYSLEDSPDGLIVDEGYVAASIVRQPDDNLRMRCELLKRVDFADSVFGGPSTFDLLAPSYIGSWLRVQQDLWAASVIGPDLPEKGAPHVEGPQDRRATFVLSPACPRR